MVKRESYPEIWKKGTVKIMMGKTQTIAKCVYFNTEISTDMMSKWRWYFKYRCARFQYENPTYYVEMFVNFYDYIPEKNVVAKRMKGRITAKKAKVTEINNKWDKFKREWNSLFPIESDSKYQATVDKIYKLNFELKSMEMEYSELIN